MGLIITMIISINKLNKKNNKKLSELFSDIGIFSNKKSEINQGIGEFGLELTNPIPTSSIPESYLYLTRLRTMDGSGITFKRIGSMSAPNINDPIDAYKIYSNGIEITTIYICGYYFKTSNKAPKGFKLKK